jgi:hypothetical protein
MEELVQYLSIVKSLWNVTIHDGKSNYKMVTCLTEMDISVQQRIQL